MKSSTDQRFIIGLDLGVQSVGWAKIPYSTEDMSKENVRLGVRCFDVGSDGTEDDFSKGKDESPNKVRRGARSIRRNLWRRRRRQVKLFNLLKNFGLLPDQESNTPEKRQDLLNKLDNELRFQYKKLTHQENLTFLYWLRAKALDEKLSLIALGRILYHLGQRRGFLSNKKTTPKEGEDAGQVKEGISNLQKEIKDHHCRTLGEYFSTLNPEDTRIRQRWTGRAMFKDEFEQIWESQKIYYPDILNDRLKKKIYTVLFFQRPLKNQKFLIGQCELEAGNRNIAVADLLFQQFRYWQRILDLTMLDENQEFRPLTREEQDKIAQSLENNEKLTFSNMRKVLNLKQPKQTEEEKKNKLPKIYSFNFEVDGDDEKGIIGNRTRSKIVKILNNHNCNYDVDDVENLTTKILQYENEQALANHLRKLPNLKLGDAASQELAELTFESGYGSLSKKAIKKILPVMIANRIPYATARKQVYGNPLKKNAICDQLPPVKKVFPSLKNPAVIRTLTEMRRVVNALIREYGKPEMFHVELARDLKKSRKQRKLISDNIQQQTKKRENAQKKIIEETGISNPSPYDILKVLLAEECKWVCPYTGKTISIRNLVGDNSSFDIEHIIPLSRSLDNSFANKTLCDSDENRHVKKNQTPYECYYGDPQRWHEILTRVKSFQGKDARRKLQLFQQATILNNDDFTNRMLNDTRYISKLAADYLGNLYGGVIDNNGKRRIQVTSGGMTAWLRDAWNLNAVLNDGGNQKNRTDHRHHAIDAVVIALTDHRAVQKLSKAALIAKNFNQRRLFAISEIQPPTDDFLNVVRDATSKIIVSHRIDKKVSGQIHKETNYGRPYQKGEKQNTAFCHHLRKPLKSLAAKDVENIVDPCIREIVRQKLIGIGSDPKKFNESNYPVLVTKSGKQIPIKKVRIKVKVSTVAMGSGKSARYVDLGNNHHIEIIAQLDLQGNTGKWEGVPVSTFEAYRRKQNLQPIIQRDHGPNKKFLFSLAKKESFLMLDENGNKQICVVLSIINKQKQKSVYYKKHTDARPSHDCRKALGLTFKNIQKISVDPIGNIRLAND